MSGTPPALELESRRRLYQHVVRSPGEHLRELQRQTGLAMGALEYHLGELQKAGLLTVRQEAHKRFFPAEMDRSDKQVLAFLRQELPRRVLVLLIDGSPRPKADLLRVLDVAPSTLNHHLGRLVEEGLVSDVREGREAVYVAKDPQRVMRLLSAYRSSLLDRWVDGFLAGTDALR